MAKFPSSQWVRCKPMQRAGYSCHLHLCGRCPGFTCREMSSHQVAWLGCSLEYMGGWLSLVSSCSHFCAAKDVSAANHRIGLSIAGFPHLFSTTIHFVVFVGWGAPQDALRVLGHHNILAAHQHSVHSLETAGLSYGSPCFLLIILSTTLPNFLPPSKEDTPFVHEDLI